MTRSPTSMLSIASVPMSSTRNDTQSVALQEEAVSISQSWVADQRMRGMSSHHDDDDEQEEDGLVGGEEVDVASSRVVEQEPGRLMQA